MEKNFTFKRIFFCLVYPIIILFWQNKGFQNLSSIINSQLETLHDIVMVWLLIIITIVLIVRLNIFKKKNSTSLRLDSLLLEVTWTLIPIGILVSIAIPRISLLCNQDTFYTIPSCSIKLTRNQWNWQREQQEQNEHLLDIIKLDELRRYENPLILPFRRIRRIFLTRRDVLHSLGVPSLGVKLDSTPGRLNAILIEPLIIGLLPGSCYELCGRGHRAIPIYMLSV